MKAVVKQQTADCHFSQEISHILTCLSLVGSLHITYMLPSVNASVFGKARKFNASTT